MKTEMTPEIFNQLSKEEKLDYYKNEVIPKLKWEFGEVGILNPTNLEYHQSSGEFLSTSNFDGAEDNLHRIKPESKYVQFTYEDRELFMGKEVRHKTNRISCFVVGCHDEQLFIGGNWVCYNIAFKHYVFADGSPFGKKVV